MKPICRIATALALVALLAAHAGAAAPEASPFDQLKSYDYQDRSPFAAIYKLIQQSLSDKAQTAQVEEHLIAVLKDPACTSGGKQEACKMLWIVGSRRSVPVLAKMLASDDTANIARYALERNADRSAARALRGALRSAEGKRLVGLINSIGNRRDARAVGALKSLSTSSDPLAAEAAITALGKIGNTGALAALKRLPVDNLRAQEAILRCAERFGASGHQAAAERVYVELSGEGHPTIARADALRGLVVIKAATVGSVALADLRSSDSYLQATAARVCGTLPQTASEAISAWSSLPAPAQAILLTAFTDRGDASIAGNALKATESQDPLLRTAAIRASARLGGVGAIPRLVELAQHGEGSDRRYARESLAGMPGAPVDKELLRLAAEGEPEVRAVLADVLAERPTSAAKLVLLDLACGSDPSAAVAALKGLTRVGGAPEEPRLVKLVVATQSDDVRDGARDAVVGIAQHIGDSNVAAEPVVAALAGASSAGRISLLQVLAAIGGDKALDVLTAAAADSDSDVKQAAVTALAESWSDSRPTETLLKIAKSDPDKVVRVEAIRGYLRLVGQDDKISARDKVAKVSRGLDAADRPEEKRQALSVLRICRVPEAVDLAAKALDNPDLVADAAEVIIYLAAANRKNDRDLPAVTGPGTKAALDKVILLTKDDDQRTRAEAGNK